MVQQSGQQLRYGRMFHNLYRVPVVILSPFMTYGPRQPMNRLIPSVMSALLRGESPKLTSGRVSFDWVYIADVIEGFIATATASRIDGRRSNSDRDSLVSVRNVVERLCELIGTGVKPLFGALPDRPRENEIAANTGRCVRALKLEGHDVIERRSAAIGRVVQAKLHVAWIEFFFAVSWFVMHPS